MVGKLKPPFGVASLAADAQVAKEAFSHRSFGKGDPATSYLCWHLATFHIPIIAPSQY